ncbi:MAG: hypothetical protein A3B96_04170 [Candidatus Spechtbacteria bacterium RIFCSPHIGHO2_02_FULL_43_15b]|uniref:Uncharacterized protein n=1 Tax=Candidatus Spechtbacteria bacterium RIFCSPHIGHO2_01_FULL_43_30 TaxID=1802158 RepID=A0A1G2H433_9BACT|nr:MAG: hypothetical protein A2827_02125 [Candidatus Spechtbacteria bacterium RIFCSPHIGHO2_01_FULL_43_30]OGZ60416.1 MAG: hypothetical protein A3B96_04170 [Candidatus Spechtbacteria bacterium RIFCSPHIGHO2_02_FULL_43_15b]
MAENDGNFWNDWAVLELGPVELTADDFFNFLEAERELMKQSSAFVITDINSPFYEDYELRSQYMAELDKFSIYTIKTLKDMLEDPFPSAFSASLDESQRKFYEKMVMVSEELRRYK